MVSIRLQTLRDFITDSTWQVTPLQVESPRFIPMLINNLTSRLRIQPAVVSATRESERQRIKDATRRLRTHAEKIAWHLAEMASQSAPSPGH